MQMRLGMRLWWLGLLALAVQAGGERVVIDNVDRYQVMDPLFEGVRVVMSQRGEEYSPAYIQGISGGAFRIAGICPCAPTCSAAMEPQELVKLLGYELDYVPLFGEGVDPARDVHKIVARVKDEIRAGRPVVVWHAFTNAEWDVVCGFDDEKNQFIGRGSYAGLADYATADETRTAKCLDICPAIGAMFIGAKVGELDARTAELNALEEAVRHSRAPRDRFLAEVKDRELPFRLREGVACFDAWIQSHKVAPERTPSVGDRYCLGVYRSTHRAAAGFVREIAPKYPEARDSLEQAGRYFELEADALDEIRDKLHECWNGWQQPDPQRAARTVELLADARDNYAHAMDEIEQALVAIDPGRAARTHEPTAMKRGPDSLSVGPAPRLAWGQGRDNTFAGTLQAATRVTEHPYTYEDIMGLTGLAFRVRWCNADTKTSWCPSAAIGEMPDEQAAAARLTGWQLQTDYIEPEGRDNEALRRKIVASIDAGKPVTSYPTTWDMGVIHGYEDEGKTLLVSTYGDEEPVRLTVDKLGPLQTYLTEYRTPPPMRDCLIQALQTAVDNWQRERHDGGIEGREYWYGDAALNAWIGDLKSYDALPGEAREGLRGLDGWVLTSLADARRAAGAFLKEWAIVLDGPARGCLLDAAGSCETACKALEPLMAAARENAEKRDFSPAAREREIAALMAVRNADAAAIAQIAKTLAMLE